jgi:hypothetical protein
MENTPESSPSRRHFTHDDAKKIENFFEMSVATDPEYADTDLSFSLGVVETEEGGFMVTIRVRSKDLAIIADHLAKKYISDKPYEIRITGAIQAG